MSDLKKFEELYNYIKIIIENSNNQNLKLNKLNLEEDKKYIFNMFINLTDSNYAKSLNLSTSNYLEYTLNDWIILSESVKLGFFSFLHKSKGTLGSIYRLAKTNELKDGLIIKFKELSIIIRRKHNLFTFGNNLNNLVSKSIDTQDRFDEIVFNLPMYKEPKYVGNLIDSLVDEDFRKTLTKTIFNKLDIDITTFFQMNDENDSNNNDDVEYNIFDTEDPLVIIKNLFDFIIKIPLTGNIKTLENVTNILYNYIKDLFVSSEVLSSICSNIDKEYNLLSKDKNLHFYKKNCKLILCKTDSEIYKNNYKSGLENIDWEKIYKSEKIHYKSIELKQHILYILLKLFELFINLKNNKTEFNSNIIKILEPLFQSKSNINNTLFNNIFQKFETFKITKQLPSLECIIDDILIHKNDLKDLLNQIKDNININIFDNLPIQLNKNTKLLLYNKILLLIDEIIQSIVTFDESNTSLNKIKFLARKIDNIILKFKNKTHKVKIIKQKIKK